jgi:trans-aconitate methyltransferase
LVESAIPVTGSVLDVGAGRSTLVDELLADSFEDLTILDVSAAALESVHQRLARHGRHVNFIHADLLGWNPVRTFDVWHDRAVFHFLTRAQDRARYLHVASEAVGAAGTLIVAAFASDGPTHCSGLPVCRYDPAELAAEFESTFEPVHSEREEHRTPAGVLQPFTWAVLRRR